MASATENHPSTPSAPGNAATTSDPISIPTNKQNGDDARSSSNSPAQWYLHAPHKPQHLKFTKLSRKPIIDPSSIRLAPPTPLQTLRPRAWQRRPQQRRSARDGRPRTIYKRYEPTRGGDIVARTPYAELGAKGEDRAGLRERRTPSKRALKKVCLNDGGATPAGKSEGLGVRRRKGVVARWERRESAILRMFQDGAFGFFWE